MNKLYGLLGIGAMIAWLETLAIFVGMNGTMFASSVGALTLIFGYALGKKVPDIDK